MNRVGPNWFWVLLGEVPEKGPSPCEVKFFASGADHETYHVIFVSHL